MKTILCFGDSNTWGYDPEASSGAPEPVRHAEGVRWTGVLQSVLGADYRVVEEGLNGRTTVHEDPLEEGRNGERYLAPCLQSHKPVDLVILMLGTNDLKARFHLPAGDVAEGAARLVRLIQGSGARGRGRSPQVLLVAPPEVTDLGHLPVLEEKFAGAPEKSLRFPGLYEAWAGGLGVGFVNAQQWVRTSRLDGLHLEASEHRKLGEAMAVSVVQMLG
ncbi:MAG: hypothetical protein RLZZ244_948 [Verrucomicrobiota bacterium]|jgi:lysophospholipase L1-like esterase